MAIVYWPEGSWARTEIVIEMVRNDHLYFTVETQKLAAKYQNIPLVVRIYIIHQQIILKSYFHKCVCGYVRYLKSLLK